MYSSQICNLWRQPAQKRFFEESFIDALKSVREASRMAHRLCPQRGLFFKVCVSSLIDMSSLFSLSIKDLCDYNTLTIRIRLYELISAPTATPTNSDSNTATGATSSIGMPPPEREVFYPSGGLSTPPPPTSAAPSGRVMSVSRRVAAESAPPKHMSVSRRDAGAVPLTPAIDAAAFLVDPDSCRVVLETTLNCFIDGLTIFRSLYSTVGPLSVYLQSLKQRLSAETQYEAVSRFSLAQSLFRSPYAAAPAEEAGVSTDDKDLVYDVVRAVTDTLGGAVSTHVPDESLPADRDYSSLSCSELFYLYSAGVDSVKEALNSAGLEGDGFKACFLRACASNSSGASSRGPKAFLSMLVQALESSLSESVVACFDAAENLILKAGTIDNFRAALNFAESSGIQQNFDELKVLLRSVRDLRRQRSDALYSKDPAYAAYLSEEPAEEGYPIVMMSSTESYSEGNPSLEAKASFEDTTTSSNSAGAVLFEDSSASSSLDQRHGTEAVAVVAEGDVLSAAENSSSYDIYWGAEDWAQCIDEASGHSYIFSQSLNESRWLQ